MTLDTDRLAWQLRSLVTSAGRLEVYLERAAVPVPGDDEVVVRIEAAPLNPSDQGLLFGAADLTRVTLPEGAARPTVTAPVPDAAMRAMAGRLDQPMPVGNEGAGVVVEAGASASAQALLGKTVAALGGGMYAQYRCLPVEQCLVLPDDATPADGASCFVNPLTALGMLETMKREGHHALVHTAAASNLGQMLNRVCAADGVPLVNVVRRPDQAELLRGLGAAHVCDQSQPDFMDRLTDALAATGATLAFDATGGGRLAGQILSCMEAALNRGAKTYSRYGSTTHKQVYLYGRLDTSPTVFERHDFGMAWGVGGWLVFPYLNKLGPHAVQALKHRVASELKTTFASRYAREVSLAEVLDPQAIAVYAQRSTGAKFLVNPARG